MKVRKMPPEGVVVQASGIPSTIKRGMPGRLGKYASTVSDSVLRTARFILALLLGSEEEE